MAVKQKPRGFLIFGRKSKHLSSLDYYEVINLHSSACSLQEELGTNLNIPPPSYADFLKDGLKDAGIVGSLSLPLKVQALHKSFEKQLVDKFAIQIEKPTLKR